MSDWSFEQLAQTAEYKGGTFALVFLAITMVLTLVLQLPGTWAQWKEIKDPNQSVEALDMPFAIALAGYFCVFFIYGAHIHSIGAIFNAVVLGPILGMIVLKLDERRGMSEEERYLFWFVAGAAFLAMFWPVQVYTISSFVTMVFPVLQILTIKRKGTSEGVNPKLSASYGLVCVVWSLYGYFIGDYFIMGVAGIFIFLYWGIVLAWWLYRPIVVARA